MPPQIPASTVSVKGMKFFILGTHGDHERQQKKAHHYAATTRSSGFCWSTVIRASWRARGTCFVAGLSRQVREMSVDQTPYNTSEREHRVVQRVYLDKPVNRAEPECIGYIYILTEAHPRSHWTGGQKTVDAKCT